MTKTYIQVSVDNYDVCLDQANVMKNRFGNIYAVRRLFSLLDGDTPKCENEFDILVSWMKNANYK